MLLYVLKHQSACTYGIHNFQSNFLRKLGHIFSVHGRLKKPLVRQLASWSPSSSDVANVQTRTYNKHITYTFITICIKKSHFCDSNLAYTDANWQRSWMGREFGRVPCYLCSFPVGCCCRQYMLCAATHSPALAYQAWWFFNCAFISVISIFRWWSGITVIQSNKLNIN